jgi:hypothetical protein
MLDMALKRLPFVIMIGLSFNIKIFRGVLCHGYHTPNLLKKFLIILLEQSYIVVLCSSLPTSECDSNSNDIILSSCPVEPSKSIQWGLAIL